MSSPQWLSSPPLLFLWGKGRDLLVAPGCQQSQWDRVIHIHTCHTLFALVRANTHMHSALCTPSSSTTSTSSGPFITRVAPLYRANGMAGLLVLERDVVRRVEQRAKDGSLIDLGRVVLSRGWGCGVGACHWPMLPFLSSCHPSAPPHLHFSCFSFSYLLSVSVYPSSTVFPFLQPSPLLPLLCIVKRY